MTTEFIQIRGVPTGDVDVPRARAVAANVSLPEYGRNLIHAAATRTTMSEALAQIATRTSIDASPDDIRSFIESSRTFENGQ